MSGIVWANLVVASWAVGAGDVASSLVVPNGAVEFVSGERGAYLSRWDFKAEGDMKHLIASEPAVPLWSVTVQDSAGERSAVTALDGPAAVREASPTRLVLAWAGVTAKKVDVTVTVTVRGADLVWAMEAAVNAERCALWDITFPEIGPVARPEAVHSISTGGWGLIHEDLAHRPLIEGKYPSAECAMPFAAVSDGAAGLYVGAEDPDGYPLRLFVGQGKGRTAVSLGVRHEIPGMGEVAKYTIPTVVTTRAYEGDWYEAGRIYRAAAKAPCGDIPPLAQRKDVAKWLTDTDLWYIGACEDEKTAAGLLDFAAYFKVPVSAHVYSWHQIPFDDHYPEYFPAKPGFKDAVAKVQKAGVPVMPYINGRLWDSATTSWTEKNAKDSAAIKEDGKPYQEVYGSKVPLTPMCPSTKLWQDTVTQLVEKLTHEVGVKGVYIDQISAAPFQRCFAPNHGHPHGGGNYWIQGYKELARRCRAVLPEGAALTTEENADPWNDLLHGFLMVNTHERGGRIVPLYPAVYGGRVVYFGFQYFSGEDYAQRYPLRLKLARELTFGSQLGWVGMDILSKQNVTEAEFLAKLCQTRHGARDALQFGEMAPPVGLECKATVSWTEDEKGVKQAKTAPAVVAGAWNAPGGRRVLTVVNVANEAETVALTLNATHVGDTKAEHVALKSDSATTAATLKRDGKAYRGALTIPARSSMALEIAAG